MTPKDKIENKVENEEEKTVATDQVYSPPQVFEVGETVELIQGAGGYSWDHGNHWV